MKPRKNYETQLNVRIDPNIDMLITELHKKLGKSKSELIRLILNEFINRNETILDENIVTKADKDIIMKNTFKGLYAISKTNYENYLTHEKEKLTR